MRTSHARALRGGGSARIPVPGRPWRVRPSPPGGARTGRRRAAAATTGGVGLLFKAGQIVKRMKADDLEGALVEEALKIAAERSP